MLAEGRDEGEDAPEAQVQTQDKTMTPLRLLPVAPAMTPAEKKANRLALLGVAVEVRRVLGWELRLAWRGRRGSRLRP